MSSFLYKKIWHGISIHTRKCIPKIRYRDLEGLFFTYLQQLHIPYQVGREHQQLTPFQYHQNWMGR